MARSITMRMPSSSISRMVKTLTPEPRTTCRSCASRSRTPIKRALLRPQFGCKAEDMRQRFRTVTQVGGKRHAVHIAAGAGLRRVHVGVGVNPKATHFLIAVVIELGNARLRADGHRVVTAQRDGKVPCLKRLADALRHLLRSLSNFLQILGALVAERLFLRQPDVDIAAILDRMPQTLQGVIQSRGAHGRRPHVHAPPLLPQVQRNTEDFDFQHTSPFHKFDRSPASIVAVNAFHSVE